MRKVPPISKRCTRDSLPRMLLYRFILPSVTTPQMASANHSGEIQPPTQERSTHGGTAGEMTTSGQLNGTDGLVRTARWLAASWWMNRGLVSSSIQ